MLKFLLSLFGGGKQNDDPPSEKQIKYASKLGIANASQMSKQKLSDAIAAAEKKNPEVVKDRDRIKTKVRENEFGKELIQAEEKWNRFADDTRFMLAIFARGKNTIVDVLEVCGAEISDKGKLILNVVEPKRIKDRDIGDHLDWEKFFDLPIAKLLHHEPLHKDFNQATLRDLAVYHKAVERGIKLAKRL